MQASKPCYSTGEKSYSWSKKTMLWFRPFCIWQFCCHMLSYSLFLNAPTRSLMEPAALKLCISAAGEAGRPTQRPGLARLTTNPLFLLPSLENLKMFRNAAFSAGLQEMQDFFSAQQSQSKRCQENSRAPRLQENTALWLCWVPGFVCAVQPSRSGKWCHFS